MVTDLVLGRGLGGEISLEYIKCRTSSSSFKVASQRGYANNTLFADMQSSHTLMHVSLFFTAVECQNRTGELSLRSCACVKSRGAGTCEVSGGANRRSSANDSFPSPRGVSMTH